MRYLAASCWIALYLSLVVLLGQILERVSARYPRPKTEPALERLKLRYEQARRELIEREVRREASRILKKLDDDGYGPFMDTYEYRRSADGGRAA